MLVDFGKLEPASLPRGELPNNLRVVLANYDGPTPPAAWAEVFKDAGVTAPITVVPAPLTNSELASDVAALMNSQGC